MAVGNNASITATVINQQIAQDAQWLRNTYDQLNRRYSEWNQNVPVAVMSTAGITSVADQNTIIALVGDMNILIGVMNGSTLGVSHNMVFDVTAVSGIQ